MKRLVLLLPLFLTSCAGHDLVSDEPFQMKCPKMYMVIEYQFVPGYMIAGPKLPFAQARRWDGFHMEMLERMETTSSKIIFKGEHKSIPYTLKIDRNSGKVFWASWKDQKGKAVNYESLANCSFRPLNFKLGWGRWAQTFY
ncbi:hypothetical protein OAL32_03320 [Synechococcus sp. AH-551-G15]|nr:hypothetical protein [Synechococcus sp. AH-551-G15]